MASTPSPRDDADDDLYAISPPQTHADSFHTKRKLNIEAALPDKRRRLACPQPRPSQLFHGLSPELWQRVFTFLAPTDLTASLHVNRLFHTLLTRTTASHSLKDSDAIWQSARDKLVDPAFPVLPAPCSERQLWHLLGQRSCQFCRDQPVVRRSADSPGPGNSSAQIIWPFAVVSCGPCLRERVAFSDKLLTTADAIYVPILRHAFLSDDNNVQVAGIQDGVLLPAPAGMRKVIFEPHLQKRKRSGPPSKADYDRTKLDIREELAIVSHWDEWEMNNPDPKMPEIKYPRPQQRIRALVEPRSPEVAPSATVDTDSLGNNHRTPGPSSQLTALRRLQIEERCGSLNPPIPTELLDHMETFDAALKINSEMTDGQWAALAPRLLSERYSAEKRRSERVADKGPVAEKTSDSMTDQEIRERFEMLQKPIRDKLSDLFDEFVRNEWADGQAINKETAPRFATEVLVNIKNRYDAAGLPKLKLDNMRWVHEHKVKPLAYRYRDDLYRCAECGPESKLFGFEGLIQHSVAKHPHKLGSLTAKLSFHSTAWPDEPLFVTHGRRGRQGRNTPANRRGMGPPATSVYTGPDFNSAPGPSQMGSPPPFHPYAGYNMPSPSPMSSHFSYPHANATSPVYSWHSGRATPAQSPFENQTPFSSDGRYGPTPAHNQGPYPSAASPAPGGNFIQMQTETIVQIAVEIWDALFVIKKIPPTVRCSVLIHHVVSRFKQKFSNEPNLDFFTQTLIFHPRMQQIKEANGCVCKSCAEANHGVREFLPFYRLCLHFQKVHIEQALLMENASTHLQGEHLHRLDWKKDMMELPDSREIAALSGAMDPAQFRLIHEAFPDLVLDPGPVWVAPVPYGYAGSPPPGPAYAMSPPAPPHAVIPMPQAYTYGQVQVYPVSYAPPPQPPPQPSHYPPPLPPHHSPPQPPVMQQQQQHQQQHYQQYPRPPEDEEYNPEQPAFIPPHDRHTPRARGERFKRDTAADREGPSDDRNPSIESLLKSLGSSPEFRRFSASESPGQQQNPGAYHYPPPNG